MTERPESDYLDPPNFEAFHECSEQRQWELFRDMRRQRDEYLPAAQQCYDKITVTWDRLNLKRAYPWLKD